MVGTQSATTDPQTDDVLWFRELVRGVFDVEDATAGALNGSAIRLRGHFLTDSAEAYARLAPTCRARGHTLLLREDEGRPALFLMRGVVRPSPNNRWLPILLGVITVLSMLFAYTLFWEATELSWTGIVSKLGRGWGFTLSLLAILLSHEFGHYLMARRLGVAVTFPFLIPFPVSPFGTMGAVIRLKDVPPSRKAMLYIGAAGPLAGVLVAIPVILIGLSLSQVAPLPTEGGYTMEGSSLLYMALKWLSFGRLLPANGVDVLLHPVAFAGWAGLLVTSLNLIPAGQLDGGHIAYALLGAKAGRLTWIVIGIVLLLGVVWQGWLVWAVVIYVFSRIKAQPLDDLSPLRKGEAALAVVMLVVFVLTFTPLPMTLVQ
ncbi:MAG: site-2 protease family protein [Anaerolineae bacterium]